MFDIYIDILKYILLNNLFRLIVQLISFAFIMYIAYDFFCRKEGHIYKNEELEKKGRTGEFSLNEVNMFITSKNILGFVTFLQWLSYEFTVSVCVGKLGDAFSLVIPLLYTYIFENLYTVIANEKNIHPLIQKSHLDNIKISNIILIVMSIIQVSFIGTFFQKEPLIFFNYYFTVMFSFILSYFVTVFMMKK